MLMRIFLVFPVPAVPGMLPHTLFSIFVYAFSGPRTMGVVDVVAAFSRILSFPRFGVDSSVLPLVRGHALWLGERVGTMKLRVHFPLN